jgi:transcriptional regulator of acetoin/glycerol metabolism
VEIREQTMSVSDQGRQSGFLGEKARMLEQFEYDYMVQLLKTCNGDVSAVARMADISRQSVYRMLARLELNADEFRQ